jgi:hypothetical protein
MSTTEVLVALTVTALIVAVSIAGVSRARRGRATAVCTANLHAIGVAFTAYATDNNDLYPPAANTAQWEDFLRAYIHRNAFRCPADAEIFAALGSSYDWRDTGNPLTTLAGRSQVTPTRNDVSLAFDALPGWHAQGKVNVLLNDQSILMMDQEPFFKDLQRPPDH